MHVCVRDRKKESKQAWGGRGTSSREKVKTERNMGGGSEIL